MPDGTVATLIPSYGGSLLNRISADGPKTESRTMVRPPKMDSLHRLLRPIPTSPRLRLT